MEMGGSVLSMSRECPRVGVVSPGPEFRNRSSRGRGAQAAARFAIFAAVARLQAVAAWIALQLTPAWSIAAMPALRSTSSGLTLVDALGLRLGPSLLLRAATGAKVTALELQ